MHCALVSFGYFIEQIYSYYLCIKLNGVPKQRVLLGMSGGMDSSMSAVLLQQQGYEVIGATLLTHTDENNESIIAAKDLAEKRGIEHCLVDCRKTFKDEVIAYFADEYIKGRTPNPCIRCNETIKWKYLLDMAEELNCQHIATGHYVRKATLKGVHYIQKGIDPAKDQSYFLWNLSQKVIEKALFPLGILHKKEVRELARSLGYTNIADQKESMGVCFLSGTDYREYLSGLLVDNHPALSPGPVVDRENKVLGQHDGFSFYTIGQRRGIEGIAKGKCVVAIDADNKTLIAGKREELMAQSVELQDYYITPDTELWTSQKLFIRIRGLDSVPGYSGMVELNGNNLLVNFDDDVWALTPGQSVVFYTNDILIGGGIV